MNILIFLKNFLKRKFCIRTSLKNTTVAGVYIDGKSYGNSFPNLQINIVEKNEK